MREPVRAAFVRFTAPLEGVVPFMYLDVKGLVTTGVGNLIDPIQFALPLPFVRGDGTYATRNEIAAEWLRVKAAKELRHRGGMVYRDITSLRLTDEGIQLLVSRKLDQVDQHLAARFDGYRDLCSDAQLGLLSIAWACGAGFRFPLFEGALKARDFALAAIESRMDERGNPGLRPRNMANAVLFSNAAAVKLHQLDPEPLYWPRNLMVDIGPEDDTLPGVVVETDGGESRRRATSEAITDAVRDLVTERAKVDD